MIHHKLKTKQKDRKQYFFKLLLCSSFCMLFNVDVMCQTVFTEGVLEYTVVDSVAGRPLVAVTRMAGKLQRKNMYESLKLNIPSQIRHEDRHYLVSEIASGAFSNSNDIESIEISNGIEFIEANAFQNCNKLESVILPNTLKSFCTPNFRGCHHLRELSVAGGNPTYDSRGNCNAIIESKTNILICGIRTTQIPDEVSVIGNNAFYGCIGLENITLHEGLTTIGNQSFSHCFNLETISLPDNLQVLGSEAFAYTSIREVTIPENVKSVGSAPFMGCSNLNSIKVKKRNKQYDSRRNCNAIVETGSNTLIGGCNTTIIPNNIKTIRRDAFRDLLNLQSISIPKKVEKIEGNPFIGCKSLVSIKVAGENPTYDSRGNCNAIIDSRSGRLIAGCTMTQIPPDIETIGDFAFYGTYTNNILEIPTNIKYIGRYAFANLAYLETLLLPANIKHIDDYAFAYNNRLTHLNIPHTHQGISPTAFAVCDTFNRETTSKY